MYNRSLGCPSGKRNRVVYILLFIIEIIVGNNWVFGYSDNTYI